MVCSSGVNYSKLEPLVHILRVVIFQSDHICTSYIRITFVAQDHRSLFVRQIFVLPTWTRSFHLRIILPKGNKGCNHYVFSDTRQRIVIHLCHWGWWYCDIREVRSRYRRSWLHNVSSSALVSYLLKPGQTSTELSRWIREKCGQRWIPFPLDPPPAKWRQPRLHLNSVPTIVTPWWQHIWRS